jgi:hypothetical protein
MINNGSFTMVYDEGFEVRIGPMTFFAFSNFVLPTDGDESKSSSRCYETNIGWYRID